MTIEEAVEKYHWIKFGDDGVVEMYLDHHALSSFRMCEGAFEEAHLKFYKTKGRLGWPLAFGLVFHKVVEYLYESKAIDAFDPNRLFAIASEAWDKAGLDFYSEHKTSQALGGKQGFIALVMQYAGFYSGEVERLRPIGTEIAFGKNKEVPLGEFQIPIKDRDGDYYEEDVRCYLTGRIDFLMDSGTAIGPMDHKTKAFFKGDPMGDYDPQEGMTGYIFATQHIIRRNFPELAEQRKLDRMWMNFVQVKNEPDVNKRFKRIPLFKTEWQLEQYRLRQLSTFKKIYEMVISGRTPDWNTAVCSNYYHMDCPYKQLHRQGSEASQLIVLNNDYEIKPAWDPAAIED